MDDRVNDIDCIRVTNSSRSVLSERVATESLLELSINDEYVRSFIHSAGLEEQLVLGYLLSSGTISDLSMIKRITMERENRCNVELSLREDPQDNPQKTNLTSNHSKLKEYLSLLKKNQHLHISTRGFHSALLFDTSSGEWFVTEDIGRHNAVDKVIGYCAQMNYDFHNCILFTSGRLVSDIVSKGVNSNIPLIASMTVATEKGIQIAKMSKTTLIGSLSDDGFWLYNEGRVEITT